MKNPAVTMVAQSGLLPPPLGLLGVGVLKSLQGLSLGMWAGSSLLLPPLRVLLLCAIRGMGGPGSSVRLPPEWEMGSRAASQP